MPKENCPKCGSVNAYYELEDEDTLVLKCTCGLHKYLKQVVGGVTIETRLSKYNIRIPKQGSKMSKTLNVLVSAYPRTVDTKTIVGTTNESMSDVCSRLSVLFNRQLIERVENDKNKLGCSVWVLSPSGAQLLLGREYEPIKQVS
jgi:hypothetical protein